MASLKSLAKDTAIYGMSSIVGRFLNYLLVPLYTHTLKSCADYGIVNDLYAQVALLLVILTFGMETTFFRFANKDADEVSVRRVFSSALFMVGCVSGLFLLLVLGFLPGISSALGYSNHPEYIAMMATIVAMDAFQAILFSLLRFQKKALKFASFKMLFILLNCTMNVLAYAIIPHYWESWTITVGYTFIINLICTGTIMLCFYKEVSFFRFKSVDKAKMKEMLGYSWPLLVLGIAGILNQVAGQILLPRLLDQQAGRTALGIYGACLKVAMIMALITQAFRYAYEPFVFAGVKDKNNPETLAKVMKFFIVFTLLAFLAVVAYMDILKHLVGAPYRVGLDIIPICMMAEIFMGIYFNLSFWYKLTDRTIWGAWFSGAGCLVLILINVIFIPQYSYIACAWAGVAGYGTAMLLSYFVGQHYYPINYPLKSIGFYFILTGIFFVMMKLFAGWTDSALLHIVHNTVWLIIFLAIVIWRDFPLSGIPVIGKYFKK